ncbi:MAG: helical backbone metal receptor [Euryarchaeota archaeon]|nr:helical backbone metal receptor [Euryarchaeota archaeon]
MDKNRNNKVRYFILLFSVVLFSLSLISVSLASASSGITQWNSMTEDVSDSFSVDIHIDESAEVEFTVSSDLTYEWTWSVNKEEIEESEGENSNLVYVFEEYGIYNISVVGIGENETTECAYWNVTVWLVIEDEDENDVRELEGLEDYILRISKRPERIISMAPSCTEILFAVGAGDRVVGVTDFCDYPPEVEEKKDEGKIKSIGGYSTPSFEKIVDLEPDLVVGAYGNPDDVIYRLVEFGYPVYAQHPKNIEEILAHIKVTGAITKCEEETASLVEDLKGRLDEVDDQTDSLEEEQMPRVFYNIGTFFTTGDDTFINEIIEIAGGTNIAADKSGYFIMNLEELIDKNPQVIICDSGMGSISTAYEEIMSDERLKIVDAVINNQVYVIDGDITSRAGPRVVDAVEIVHADYADFFDEMEEGEEETIPLEITSQEPVDTQINNIEGESRTFAISIDQTVDIVWQVDGTEVQTDESVTEAAYTNTSATVGIWNVSAIATNRATGLSEMHTWIWNVTPALAAATPTPVVNITATPSPAITTTSPTSTPASTAAITPTPAQASAPTPRDKQKSEADGAPVPGFEAVLAVVILLAVMYFFGKASFKRP